MRCFRIRLRGLEDVEFGRFQLDANQKTLMLDGHVVRLGPTVVQTLAVLVAHRDQVVSREELIRQVWGDTAVEENSLTRNILLLRKALKEDPSGSFRIETIPRRGYRFCSARGSAQKRLSAEVTASRPEAATMGGRHWYRIVFSSAVLLSIAVASILLTGYHPRADRQRSVAVLGFANMSHQPGSAWLSPALTEMMTTELAAGGNFLTASGENVARARSDLKLTEEDGFSASTLRRLRQELNADVVVCGAYAVLPDRSAQTGDGQIRLDVRVQDAESGDTLDAISEVGQQSNLFDLVARAGARVRRTLGATAVTPEQLVQAKSSLSASPQAVQLYAEGIQEMRRFEAIGAREFFQQAIHIDPNFALAHSALSEALDTLGYDGKSGEEAKKAFELSGNLSPEERLSIEGRYRMATRNWGNAVAVYDQLFHLFPDNLDDGLRLASAQNAASDPQGALATLGSLRRLPRPSGEDPRISLEEFYVWKSLGDYGQMEKALSEAAETAKKNGALLLLAEASARQCWVKHVRAEPDLAIESCREAQSIYQAAGDRSGEAQILRNLGSLASSSDRQAAIRYFQQALALAKQSGDLVGQGKALLGLGLEYSSHGEHEAARKVYEQSLAIFRDLDRKPEISGLTLNLGNELLAEGELQGAKKRYQEALESATRIGNKWIQALAELNLGTVDQLGGDLGSAQQLYQAAGRGFEAVGNKEYDVGVTRSLAQIAMAQGDLGGARMLYEKAMKQASQQKLSAAGVEMEIDQLSLEEGRVGGLETSLRHIVERFRDGSELAFNHAHDDRVSSLALLARCLLAEGHSDLALSVIRSASEMSRKADTGVRLSVEVIAARVRFARQGENSATQVLDALRKTIEAARRLGYLGIELEARLAFGEIELKSGALVSGRIHLQEVETDASRRGLALLARKAKLATQTPHSSSGLATLSRRFFLPTMKCSDFQRRGSIATSCFSGVSDELVDHP